MVKARKAREEALSRIYSYKKVKKELKVKRKKSQAAKDTD